MARTSRIDLLQGILVGEAFRREAATHLLDRIVLRAHPVDLLLAPIFRRIGHGVAAIAVGQHFQDDRAIARTTPLHRLIARSFDGAHIHAVDLLAGNLMGETPLGQVGRRRRTGNGCPHSVLVVLDDVDHRQLPQLGHVEALVDLALVGGAVAEIGERHVVVAAIPIGEGEPASERNLGADDAVTAEETLLDGKHVHGAALASGIPAAPAGQLRHHAPGVHAAGQHMAMVAVSGNDLISRLDRHLHADDDRLLADIEMAEAPDQPHAIELAGLFLESADEQHVAIGEKLLLPAEFGHRSVRGCTARCGGLDS